MSDHADTSPTAGNASESIEVSGKWRDEIRRIERVETMREEIVRLDLESKRVQATRRVAELESIDRHNKLATEHLEREAVRSARYSKHLDEWIEIMQRSVALQERQADALDRIAVSAGAVVSLATGIADATGKLISEAVNVLSRKPGSSD